MFLIERAFHKIKVNGQKCYDFLDMLVVTPSLSILEITIYNCLIKQVCNILEILEFCSLMNSTNRYIICN